MHELASLDRELAMRGGLYDWVRLAWPQVEPNPFVAGWHLEVICDHLEQVSRGEIRKLLINIPPGCTKSLVINVFFPVWEWLHRPGTRFVFASFDSALVGRRDGGKVVNLLRSKWFLDRFPPLLAANRSPSAYDFDILGGGFRFSTSPGGKGTGRHANIVCVDDPIKPKDTMGGAALTHKLLERVSEWWAGTMSTRRVDPATHREIVTMQRLHKDDLAGEMLRQGGWTHLCLPMRFEKAYSCPADRRAEDGELLWPARFPLDTVDQVEKSLGPTNTAAQHQQRPNVKGGGIFKRSWWKWWHVKRDVPTPCMCDECFDALVAGSPGNPEHVGELTCALLPKAGSDVQSWDMTFKGKATSDFVAGGAWRAYGGNFYLRHLVNERLSFSETKLAVLRMCVDYPCPTVLVEDAANGPAIENELREHVPGIELVKPQGGKEARANACEAMCAAGKVFLPHPDICPAVRTLLGQAESFPADLHDDIVDMLTQALVWYRKSGAGAFLEALDRISKRSSGVRS